MIQDIAPAFLDNSFKPEVRALPGSPVFYFEGNRLALKEDGSVPLFKDIEADDLIYLFDLTKTPCFLTRKRPEGLDLTSLREIRQSMSLGKDMAFAVYTACHLASWYDSSDYCGRCGHKTTFGTKERSRICPECGNENAGNFCTECGTKKPEERLTHCPNCGWEIPEGQSPNFCTECGTKLK